MFPNYCFTKSARHFGYDVIRRNYSVKDSTPRLSARSEISAKNRTEVQGADPGLKRLKRPKKSTPSAAKDLSSRSVKFLEDAGNEQPQSPKPGPKNEMPSQNPNCDLQESFADFFSIIHDNVMDSVKEAVQGMVAKCFEESMTKMERLSKEILRQEAMLNKIYSEVTSKISAQSETNLNQFKFVTQMLIDNQTVHYRALNQARQNRLRRKEEREQEQERKLEWQRKRSGSPLKGRSSSMDPTKRSSGGDGKETPSRGPQHQLCQQQQPLFYHICQSCTDQDSKRMPRHTNNTPRLQRRNPSYSMPNLTGRTSKQSPTGASRSSVSRPYNNREDQVVCLPAMTYPPCAPRGSVPQRRFLQRIKSGIGQGEVKGKR